MDGVGEKGKNSEGPTAGRQKRSDPEATETPLKRPKRQAALKNFAPTKPSESTGPETIKATKAKATKAVSRTSKATTTAANQNPSSTPNGPWLNEVLQNGDQTTENTQVAQKAKILYEGPSKCRCCINWVEQYPDDLKDSASETERSKSHSIVLRYQKSHEEFGGKPIELHSLVVQSSLLKPIIVKALQGYPNIAEGDQDLVFRPPFASLFHRWDYFADIARKEVNLEVRGQLELLLSILQKELGDCRTECQELLKHGLMNYKRLWSLYAPGTIVSTRFGQDDYCFQVVSCEYKESQSESWLSISAFHADHDGKEYGFRESVCREYKFEGTKKIIELNAVPVKHHSSSKTLMQSLLDRGSKAKMLHAGTHMAYKGLVNSRFVQGRIMIDHKAYQNNAQSESPPEYDFDFTSSGIKVYLTPHKAKDSKFDPTIDFADKSLPVDEDVLQVISSCDDPPYPIDSPVDQMTKLRTALCTPKVRGYCLVTKEWAEFRVNEVYNIEWNDDALASLVIPPARKELVVALVDNYRKQEEQFDDIIKGKGQGLVILLAGEPGTGKTLTAESIADCMRLPLYALSSGQLGDTVNQIEKNLGTVLDIAAKWNAVLLLDEADVFLEQRTTNDMQRNRLVAIFLRMLEYYRGVLILTTNRITSFDAAFQSRIDLTLHYPELDVPTRSAIWANFLRSTTAEASETELQALAEAKINGRQIKNTVKMAHLLAQSKKEPLTIRHVQQVLSTVQTEGTLPQP
ncbi:MAG: hypothetical protein M1822_009058 [Bathelium mastoideum]|nr:MAG: hypothetical protein M1822_009058 [Bathelium mastoideum]